MRRLLSYILLSITMVTIVGINFLTVIGGLNANLEFSSGREMVFRLKDKEDADFIFEDDTETTLIAETMVSRLESALVTKYEVYVEGNNQIRVTVSERSNVNYTRLQKYLAFDADFTLCTTSEVCATSEDMFEDQTARIEYRGQNPIIVFPVKDPTYVTEVLLKEVGGEAGELLLWAGKLEADNYQESLKDPTMAEKIVVRFPANDLWWDETEETELAFVIPPSKYGTANANNVFDATAVAQANQEAIFYRNLFNATPLAYQVEFLYETSISPFIEPILSLSRVLTVATGPIFLASLLSIILIITSLVYFYRLGAVGMIATTTLAVFLTLFAFVWLNLEFTSAALIALLTVATLGVLTSVLYMTYLRREIYQGRGFKKAHIEASGKLIPLIIDLTVVGLVFGLFTYLFGGNIVQSFSVILMIGSVVNLLVVFVGNQVLYGQLLQDQEVQNHLSWLNLNPKLIPNALAGEKPVYFGKFAARDFTAKGSLLTSVAFVGGLLSIAAILTLTILQVPVVQPAIPSSVARIYLEVQQFSQFESTTDLEEKVLNNITLDDQSLLIVGDIEVQNFTRLEEEIDVKYRLYIVNLSPEVLTAKTFVFTNGTTTFDNANLTLLLEDIVGFYEDDRVSVIGFYPATAITNQPTVLEITFGALMGLLLVAVYLILRHGFSQAFTTILVSGATSSLTLGLFIATRIPSPFILALSLLTLTYMSALFAVVIFARGKEQRSMIKDRAIVLDDHTLSLKKSTSQSAATIFLTLATLVIPGMIFLIIGPAPLQALFASLLMGSALIGLFITGIIPATFKPIYPFFHRFTQTWTLPAFLRRGKLAPVTNEFVRSNEPQEATYIGIND